MERAARRVKLERVPLGRASGLLALRFFVQDDLRVHRIMDLKTPGGGEVEKNLWSNIDHLTLRDEVKFVIGSRDDYKWSRDKVQRN